MVQPPTTGAGGLETMLAKPIGGRPCEFAAAAFPLKVADVQPGRKGTPDTIVTKHWRKVQYMFMELWLAQPIGRMQNVAN